MEYYDGVYVFDQGLSFELAPGIDADLSYEYPEECKVVLLVQEQSVIIQQGVKSYFTYNNVLYSIQGTSGCADCNTIKYTVYKDVIQPQVLGREFSVTLRDRDAEVYTSNGLLVVNRSDVRIPGGRLHCCRHYDLKGTTRGIKTLTVKSRDRTDTMRFEII